MCLSACVHFRVCVGVNSDSCYRCIVNHITGCNSLFSVSLCVFLFWCCVC